jgi:class 3 adenylate cyclase
MERLDDAGPVEIEHGLFWIGFADYEAGFSNNPYLLLDEDEAVLFDPGPGHPLFRDMAMRKIQEILPPSAIRYVVVHHADPDLCGMLPLIEPYISPEALIVAHPRSALFLPYYGIRRPVLPVGDADALELKSGARIEFYHTPYVHFAGSMVSYLPSRQTLLSSDIFAVFDKDWRLRAGPGYPALARAFLDHYVGDHESLAYAAEVLERLPIKRILPQHGGIIESGIPDYIKVLREAHPGALLRELRSKPDSDQLRELARRAALALSAWLPGQTPPSTSFAELESFTRAHGPAALGMLHDITAKEARDMGVANPLGYGRTHRRGQEEALRSDLWADRAHRLLLTSQFSMNYGNEESLDQLIQKRFQAVQARAAVLFADARGFTAWCAGKPPDEVIGALNKQHGTVSRIVQALGGRVNKIMGDGLLAFFPDNRAQEALLAAKRIQAAASVERLLPMGLGIDYGDVVMGDVGDEERLDYTMIGEPVNAASRMCSAAAPGEIALGAAYWEALPEATRAALEAQGGLEPFSLRLKPSDPLMAGYRIKAAPKGGNP